MQTFFRTVLKALFLPSTFAALAAGPVPAVKLPIEVMGAGASTVTVTLPVVTGKPGPYQLWIQVHGVASQAVAQVQVNSGPTTSLTNSNVAFAGQGLAQGGIGGSANVLTMTVPLPGVWIAAGNNTIVFKSTGAGFTIGYRVLALNLLAGDGSQMVASSAFGQEDPQGWIVPKSTPSDISQGQWLFQHGPLMGQLPGATVSQPILAHCSDCHTYDGRDLQYFNYSNKAIMARSQLHGLTQLQGQQIASYIRTLPGPRPGRPWNPVYQPGPGLDAQPVVNWSAGAGIGALVTDQQSLAAVAAQNGKLNIRETPISIPLPDWNQWLPRVHPADAYGAAAFAGDIEYTQYIKIRTLLSTGTSYFNTRYEIDQWGQSALRAAAQLQVNWTPASAEALYSLALWRMVKQWELAQTFNTDGLEQSMYGPTAEPRGWYNNPAFLTSPNMLHIPKGGVLRGWPDSSWEYTTMSWYQLQLILNGGNAHQQGPSPVDWPYVSGVIKDLNWASNTPQSALELELLTYGLQMAALQPQGPEAGQFGWMPDMSDPSKLVHPAWEGNWLVTPVSVRSAATEAHLRRWFAKVQTFTRAQWLQGGFVSAAGTVQSNNPDGPMGDRMYYMLPRLNLLGVDPTLLSQIAGWAQRIWPNANWQAARSATCSSILNCSPY